MMRKFLMVAALVALASCTPDVTGINNAEPLNIAGAWAGTARWSALQGGAPTALSSQDASATMFQNDASVQGTWEVTSLWVGDFVGVVDPQGNVTGSMSVTVLGAAPCTASANAAGTADPTRLELRVSYADPGSTPCAGAPVSLVLEMGR